MRNVQRPLRWYAARIVIALAIVCTLGAALVYLRFRQDTAAHAQRIAAGSKVIDTPCGPVEYGERGTGRAILAVHGAGGGYDQGLLLADSVGDGFRVIAPSRFGYLNTPLPLEDASVAAQAEAYVCLLDALEVRRAAVLADSAGGPSALAFAIRHPERVEALILVSAISTLRPIRDDDSGPSAALLTDFVYWLAATYFPDAVLAAVGAPASTLPRLTPAEHARMWDIMRTFQPMSRRLPGMNLDAVEQSRPEVEALPLETITAPTLVIHATDDALIPFAQGQHSAARIPGARLVSFDYGGHLVIALEAVSREILDFMAATG